MELTGKQKRALRALGHHLKPSVNIGKQGMGEHVLEQLEEQLLARELVKVKVLKNSPEDAGELAALVERQTGAGLVQSMGRTMLFYRPHPETPVIRLPD